MLKLYLYKKTIPHGHDSTVVYRNTVPMSKDGIRQHFEIVSSHKDADYFYIGQLNDGYDTDTFDVNDYPYLEDYPEKHIVDIEGDWPNKTIPEQLRKCIITINGAKSEYKDLNIFVRPTFSHLLLDIVKNRFDKCIVPSYKSFGFKGLPDMHGCRQKMKRALAMSGVEYTCEFNNEWCGPTDPKGALANRYQQIMIDNIIALCPRGCGIDTVRFFEACFFGRVPFVIGDNILFGTGYTSLSFVYQVSDKVSEYDISNFLKFIDETPIRELQERSLEARQYFDNVVRKYFQDPTKFFIEKKLCN